MPVTGKLASIERTLDERLAALTFTPAVPVAWQDTPFTPTEPGQTYLEPDFLPNRTDTGGVGSNAPRRHRGLYQVMVHSKGGEGPGTLSDMADAVIEWFAGQILVANGVTVRVGAYDGGDGVPWRAAALRDGVKTSIPVTVPWWCDTL